MVLKLDQKTPTWALAVMGIAFVVLDLTFIHMGVQKLRWAHMLDHDAVTWDARVQEIWKAGKNSWKVRYAYRVRLLDGKPHDHQRTVEVDEGLADRLQPDQLVKIRVSKEALEDSDLVDNGLPRRTGITLIGVALFQLLAMGLIYRRVRRHEAGT